MINIKLNARYILYFKICFFMLIFIITVLSLAPHNDISTKMHEQTNSIFWELADRYDEIGSFAYIGEDLFGAMSDKIRHIFAFLVLSLVCDFAYIFKTKKFKIFLLIGYGFLIEIFQYFIPFREFGIIDIAFDVVGVLSYYLIVNKFLKVSYTPPFSSHS